MTMLFCSNCFKNKNIIDVVADKKDDNMENPLTKKKSVNYEINNVERIVEEPPMQIIHKSAQEFDRELAELTAKNEICKNKILCMKKTLFFYNKFQFF
jgi:hypothetical protein